MPKEMLPVVDRPAIQYVVEEAVAAGIDDILVIIGRNKHAISDHFDSVPELEEKLKDKGDVDRLHRVLESSDLADIHFVRQGEPKGLGHAVLRAKAHVGDASFAVMLGDDLIDERDELLTTMIAEHERTGAAIIALMEVDPSQIHLYGVASVESTNGDGVVKVNGLVEKPKAEDAPSNLAVIGRYVFTPEIFDAIRETEPGVGGEIQITDAIGLLNKSQPVTGYAFKEGRYDCGKPLDYLKATVEIGCMREDLGPAFKAYLKAFVATLD